MYEANREKILENQKKYKEENKDKIKERRRKYYEKNKKYQEKRRKDLSDTYIKTLLIQKANLTFKDIPQGLIEAQRELIKIKRFIKRENQK